MKAKKLTALLFCLTLVLALFAFSVSAEESAFCEHGEGYYEWVKYSQSCTSEGSYKYTCKYTDAEGEVCGNVAKIEKIPPHDFRAIYVGKNATCTEKGSITRYCPWCQTLENVDTEINPGNHSYGAWEVITEPTCTTEGTQIRICTREGCPDPVNYGTIPVDSNKHTPKNAQWEEIVTSTCYAEGLEKNVCSECEKQYTRKIAMHNDYSDSDKYNLLEQIPATCTTGTLSTYLCTICTAKFTVEGEVSADAHDFTNESFWEIPKDVTCSSEQKITKHCKYNYAHTIEENASHDFSGEVVNYVVPGCNADGSETVKCLHCDETETRTIPAEHTFGGWVFAEGSNCANGGTATRTCTCGEKTETTSFEPDTHLNYDILKEVSGSCLYEGYRKIKCKDCSAERQYFPEELASKGGHKPGAWVITEDATCQKAGKKDRFCDECGELVETAAIPQREHFHVVLEEGIPATCTQAGITDYLYCTLCTGVFEQEVVAASGHNFVDQKKPGEGAVRICDRCYEYEIGNITCKCLCHNSNGLAKFIYKIIVAFSKIFGINQECKCGIAHY